MSAGMSSPVEAGVILSVGEYVIDGGVVDDVGGEIGVDVLDVIEGVP